VGAVDEAFREIEFAVRGEVVGETLEDLLEHAALDPALIATVRGLIRRIARGKISPWRACAQNPKRGIHDVTRRLPRPSSLLARSPLACRDVELNRRPLRVCEVHIHVGSQLEIAVDPRRAWAPPLRWDHGYRAHARARFRAPRHGRGHGRGHDDERRSAFVRCVLAAKGGDKPPTARAAHKESRPSWPASSTNWSG
jgi:hypothetical protein